MRHQRGFNLMELMVAVTIIGILVAVALPSYNSHMISTRRAASTACVVEMAQFMERVYTTSMDYSSDAAGNHPDQTPAPVCAPVARRAHLGGNAGQ